jgi:hypothetical protein
MLLVSRGPVLVAEKIYVYTMFKNNFNMHTFRDFFHHFVLLLSSRFTHLFPVWT